MSCDGYVDRDKCVITELLCIMCIFGIDVLYVEKLNIVLIVKQPAI